MNANLLLELSYLEVTLAAGLILFNGAISLGLKLQLGGKIIWAAARTIVQLTLLGMILSPVFAVQRWYWVLAMMTAMTVIAGLSAMQRVTHRFPGIWWTGIVSVLVSSWLVAALTLGVIVRVRPWYTPQYAIPLLGMILGNTLNGISLGVDRFTDELIQRRDRIEGLLALGASRWEAAHDAVVHSVRTGMIPILNAMMVVGIVSLPGMMTGQLLSGVDPMQAVKYQIVIMFVIAAATALGTVAAVLFSYRLLFSADHRLDLRSGRSPTR